MPWLNHGMTVCLKELRHTAIKSWYLVPVVEPRDDGLFVLG